MHAHMHIALVQHKPEMNGHMLHCALLAAARLPVIRHIQQWHLCSGAQPQHMLACMVLYTLVV